MKFIRLPEEKERRLVFYLAMEEYLARYCEGGAFFVWQVEPTVIIGRNQVMAAEVNMEYCRENGVHVYRRKSGGGCVYSDRGNIMLSYITDGDDVPFLFESYLRRLALCLRNTGVMAEVSGRNDITVGGKKVSGNAFYSLHGRNVIHGTLLFSSCRDALERAITPSAGKLRSKGVSSVRQRVANLREIMASSEKGRRYSDIELFKKYIIGSFCDGERVLGEDEVRRIEEIEATYLDPVFLYGNDPACSYSYEMQVSGSGTLSVSVCLRHGAIEKVNLSGDYFQLHDGFEDALNARLCGVIPDRKSVRNALAGLDPGSFVCGLDIDMLASAFATVRNDDGVQDDVVRPCL